MPGVFNTDPAQATASLQRLADLDPNIICCGHAEPVTRNAAAILRTAPITPATDSNVPAEQPENSHSPNTRAGGSATARSPDEIPAPQQRDPSAVAFAHPGDERQHPGDHVEQRTRCGDIRRCRVRGMARTKSGCARCRSGAPQGRLTAAQQPFGCWQMADRKVDGGDGAG